MKESKKLELLDIVYVAFFSMFLIVCSIFLYNYLFDLQYMQILKKENFGLFANAPEYNKLLIVSGYALFLIVSLWILIKTFNNWRPVVCSVVAVMFFVGIYHVSYPKNKETVLLRKTKAVYEEAVDNNEKFRSSENGRRLTKAIHEKNFEDIKILTNDLDNLKGLKEEEALERYTQTKKINNPIINDYFNYIYSDGYITINEYNDFKKKLIELVEKSKNRNL